MKPHRTRYAKIETLVRELLAKYRVRSAPVPIHQIAEGEGASIVVKSFNNEVSGLLLRTGNTAIIAVEKRQAPTRQTFTVAHELGHLLLHPGQELRVDKRFRLNLRSPESSTAEDVEEIEANAFAAALLMPEMYLRTDLADFVLDIDDAEQVQELAKRYGVSAQAMTLRLVNLVSLGRL
jgi:Zn-dependent peptidase ImmA (M78 family)